MKDVRLRDGALLPRRTVLEIDGARVVDDAVGGQTRVELRMPYVERSVLFADFPGAVVDAFLCDNTDADAYRFVDVTDLIALGVPRTGGRRRVWLINADPSTAMDVENDHASAPVSQRFVTITGAPVTLAAAGGMCLAVYRSSRWYVLG